MLNTEAKIGMKVMFGRGGYNAERTLGEIIKLNDKSAKVKLLESRGTNRQYPVGTVFGVAYSLMEPADDGNPGNSPLAHDVADTVKVWGKIIRIHQITGNQKGDPARILEEVRKLLEYPD